MKSFFRLSVQFALPFTLCVATLQAESTNAPQTLPDFQSKLKTHVTQKKFEAGLFGVKIVSLDTGKIVFENDSQKLFSPASNSKLYTTALGLDRLGVDYKIKTSLYAAQQPNSRGTLKGDLIVYGRGDPTINARVHDKDIFKALQPFVDALKKAGVKRIRGDLVGDDSFYRQAPYGSGWDCDDLQAYYGAEISALTINDNYLQLIAKPSGIGKPCELSLSPPTKYLKLINQTVTVAKGGKRDISFYRPLGANVLYVSGQLPAGETNFTDDVTIHNPAGSFVTFLKEALEKNGIKVSGGVRTMNWISRRTSPLDFSKLVELGSVESLPMRDILREIQKPSQNLYTDMLLSHVAEKVRKEGEQTGSEDLGIRELNKFLGEVGIGRGETIFEEGSGLSRNNLTTPTATVKLLTFMSKHKDADVYRAALPIAGVDGTLRNRMKNTAAAGNVRAKTGTLRWANSISGYVTTAGGEHLVFSVMLNRYSNVDERRSSRQELDDIAVMLADFSGRSDE